MEIKGKGEEKCFVAKQGHSVAYPETGKGEPMIISLNIIFMKDFVYGDRERFVLPMKRGSCSSQLSPWGLCIPLINQA